MAVQPDGKIVVAGRAAEHLGDFAVVRLERDGTLDTTFGRRPAGKVLTDFAGGARDRVRRGRAGRRQDRRRRHVGGDRQRPGLRASRATTATAALDAGFGTGGKLTTAFGADADTAYALLLQADGKIVVGGDTSQGSSTTGVDFALARYNTDGTLDAGFGDAAAR